MQRLNIHVIFDLPIYVFVCRQKKLQLKVWQEETIRLLSLHAPLNNNRVHLLVKHVGLLTAGGIRKLFQALMHMPVGKPPRLVGRLKGNLLVPKGRVKGNLLGPQGRLKGNLLVLKGRVKGNFREIRRGISKAVGVKAQS